jgi:hypothetical protein
MDRRYCDERIEREKCVGSGAQYLLRRAVTSRAVNLYRLVEERGAKSLRQLVTLLAMQRSSYLIAVFIEHTVCYRILRW